MDFNSQAITKTRLLRTPCMC